MSYFEWDPKLETGFELIDEQHRSLFALANALHTVVERQLDDPQIIADAVYRLTDYVVEHFADEEELMTRFSYPGCAVHKSLHDHLTGEVLGLAARYFNGEDVRPESIASFVADWLRDHIDAVDRQAIAYVRERQAEEG